jgi:hypothetical protein
MRRLCLALALLALSACRSGGERPDPPAEPVAPPAGSTGGAGDLQGYDRDGAISCPPLPTGRQCLATTTATAARAACTAQGGEPMICEDCSVICSKKP